MLCHINQQKAEAEVQFTKELAKMLLCSRDALAESHLGTKVKERTQELSQTLEILKATQAKLVFENLSCRTTLDL